MHTIDTTIGCSRFIYNQMLQERKELYEQGVKNPKYKTEKEWKLVFPFLKEASSRALQQARGDLDQAYLNFFRGLKQGKKNGFPKFKSRHKDKWSYREPNTFSLYKEKIVAAIEIKDNKIKLNKLGYVRFRGLSKHFQGEVKSVTIIKNRDMTYEASILVEQPQVVKIRKSNNIVGLDLGLKEFLVCSNGDIIHGIKNELYAIENKIKKQNRHLSRKVRGSHRREKCRIKLAKLYKYKNNVQNHFFWHLVNQLCNENQVIGIEDLNVKGMMKNHNLAHSIFYSGWGKFITMLQQKALEYGTTVHKIDRFFPSSKTCSICGNIRELTLADRIYECVCGNTIDRDLNAAINIRNKTMKDLSLEFNDYRRGGTQIRSNEAFTNSCNIC